MQRNAMPGKRKRLLFAALAALAVVGAAALWHLGTPGAGSAAILAPMPRSAVPSPATTTVAPTPPRGPFTDCASHPGACGFPDGTTTGAHGDLAAYAGPHTISTAGAVIHDVTIAGCLVINAPNVTLRNVAISCAQRTPVYAVDTQGAANHSGTTTMDHVSVVCTPAMHGGTAFGESRMSIRWADISGCENGADADGDFSVCDSYIHDMFLGDPVSRDPHTDGIQVWPSSRNITFCRNTVLMQGANATLTSGKPAGQPPAELTVTDNLLIGGNYEVYWVGNAGTLAGNRFGDLGPDRGLAGVSPFGYCDGCGTAALSGNVLDSSGAPLDLA
jgi:hypothetical protein